MARSLERSLVGRDFSVEDFCIFDSFGVQFVQVQSGAHRRTRQMVPIMPIFRATPDKT